MNLIFALSIFFTKNIETYSVRGVYHKNIMDFICKDGLSDFKERFICLVNDAYLNEKCENSDVSAKARHNLNLLLDAMKLAEYCDPILVDKKYFEISEDVKLSLKLLIDFIEVFVKDDNKFS